MYDGNSADIITDYKAGQDTIMISDEVEFESVTVKGKNVTFNLDGGNNKLTIKNGKNKKITFVDEDGEVIDTVKYKKSEVFDTDDDDDDERDFVESPDAGSDYWFAKDDNFEINNLEMAIDDEITYSIGRIDTSDMLTNLDSSLTNKNEQILTANAK